MQRLKYRGFLSEYVVGEDTIKRGLCNGYKSGEDDLQTFDFISKLKFDLLEARYSGMTKVRGSNRMQTAYRLERDTDVILPTKYSNKNPQKQWRIVLKLLNTTFTACVKLK